MRLKDLHEKLEGRTAVFTFGRMNPPTIGHEKLLNKLKNVAGRSSADWFVYLSSSQDAKKNPLPFERKIHYAKKMFGRDVNARTFPKEPTALHAASSLYSKGYKKLIMVVGSDRVNDFSKLLKQYNNQDKPHGFYNFDSIDVVSAGERDPDAEGVSGMSASKLRGFAVQGKFDEFAKGLPGLNDKDAKSLFNEIRKGLKLQALSEKIKVQQEIIPEKVTMKTTTFRNIFKREKIDEDIMDVLKKKAEISGISLGVLKSIYEKAVKQYKLGHEIGQVKEQYAMQKVNTHLLENKNIDDTDEQFKEWMNMDEATDVVVSTPTGRYQTKTSSIARTKQKEKMRFRSSADRKNVTVKRATPRDKRFTDREPVQELDASTYHSASAKMADSDKPNKSDRALELRLKGNRKDRQDLEKSWKKGFARGKTYSQMMKQGGLSYREETEIQEMSRPHVFVGVKDTDPTSNLRPSVSYRPGKSNDFILIKPVDTNFFNENLKELVNSPYEFLEELGLHTNFGILIRDKGNEKKMVDAIAKKKSFITSGYHGDKVYAVGTNENSLRKALTNSEMYENESVMKEMESLDRDYSGVVNLNILQEKAVSKQQQKFFGLVRAIQKGEASGSPEAEKAAQDMSKKDVKDFASTKHKGLPKKVQSESTLNQKIKELKKKPVKEDWEFDPNTLLQQLGGNKFVVMTGAKNLMVDKKEKSLHMRIGKNSKGINHVKITYMPDDTYKMDFGRIRKMDYKVVRSVTGVYADALQDVFTEVTGMYTSL